MKIICNETQEQRLLLKAIEQAIKDLCAAREIFNTVDDPRLIDFAIYKEQAAKSRYDYLIFLAKEKGLRAGYSHYLIDEAKVV